LSKNKNWTISVMFLAQETNCLLWTCVWTHVASDPRITCQIRSPLGHVATLIDLCAPLYTFIFLVRKIHVRMNVKQVFDDADIIVCLLDSDQLIIVYFLAWSTFNLGMQSTLSIFWITYYSYVCLSVFFHIFT
jgi:hypothetical protein